VFDQDAQQTIHVAEAGQTGTLILVPGGDIIATSSSATDSAPVRWDGSVTLTDGTTFGIHPVNEPSTTITVNRTSALGALDAAASAGSFAYTVKSSEWGPFIDSIGGVAYNATSWDSWLYQVNGITADVGAANYTLKSGDVVTYWYGAWGSTPDTVRDRVAISATIVASPIPTPTPTVSPTVSPTPRPFRPLTIPGRIEAEEYDLGGEGVAYHDTTPGNEGGACRNDNVDIETVGGTTNVGWIRNGEFLTYTATVMSSGEYTMSASVASPNSGRKMAVSVDGTVLATIAVPNTGSFEDFRTVFVPVTLIAGTHTLKFDFAGDGQNLDWVTFASGPITITPTSTPTPPPGQASFVAVPTTAPHGSAFRFKVTPAAGKQIRSTWWTFDSVAHYRIWNSRNANPTFYYPVKGTYTPLVKITYTDGTTEEVRRANYVRAT
jgi:hypothetical protein